MACPDGVLRLGYKIEFYPYFYWHPVGKFKGSLVNFWRAVSKVLGCSSYEFIRYNYFQLCNKEGNCTKLYGGAIERGEIFAPVDGDSLHAKDARESRYSTTVLWEKMIFLESSKDHKPLRASPNLTFYTVFEPHILAIILIVYLISGAVLSRIDLMKRRNAGRTSRLIVPQFIHFLHCALNGFGHFLLFVAFAALIFIYQCYLNGNSVIVTNRPPTLFAHLLSQFARNERKVVLESGNTEFEEKELSAMFGSAGNVRYGDTVDDRLEMVCADRSAVGFFYYGDLIYYAANDSLSTRCPMSLVKVVEDQSYPVPWVADSVLRGDPYNFVYNRQNISRRVVKQIDLMLMSLYTWDNLQGIVLRRTIPIELLNKEEKFVAAHKPIVSAGSSAIPIEAMTIPLEFLAIGLATALLIFLFECLRTFRILRVWRMRIKRRL